MDIISKIITAEVDVEGILPEKIGWLFRLYIEGIEVTQAVQYYDSAEHLTDPADRRSDNALRLVANKPAWVRVYAGSVFGSSGLTGTLEVQRRRWGIFWDTVTVLSPDPSSATDVPAASLTDYAARRGAANGSLNFVVPAQEVIGQLRLVARVSAGSRSAQRAVEVGATLRQTLRLAGVMVAYDGPTSMTDSTPLTIAAPTLADLQAMSGTALTLFPVRSTANFRTAGTITLTTHLQQTSFPTSGCGPNWDALHGQVANARTADGNQPGWIYYGLLPTGVPMGPVGGCGGGGVAVGPINRPGTLAHEAGHACGLGHAPSGGAPNPDPAYPAYEPYDPSGTPQGSTGEYGLDVSTGAVRSPQTFNDLMGYAGPAWISPYHYGRLLNNARLNPRTVGIDFPWWKDLVWQEIRRWPDVPELREDLPPFELELPMVPPSRPQDVISLIVKVEDGVVVDVLHVARVRAHTEIAGAAETAFRANLRDERGEILASGAVVRLDTAAGCGPCGGGGAGGRTSPRPPTTYLAQAFVPDVGTGASLDVTKGDDAVWRRPAPQERPRVHEVVVDLDEKAGTAVVRWQASGEVTEYWLRWSADGERWRAVATGLADDGVELPLADLPPGEGWIQVVAHDGFHSTYGKPVRIRVADRPGEVVILHPVDGSSHVAGRTVRLWASVADEEIDTSDAVWSIDGQEVAHGLDAWVTLEPGEHRVRVGVAGGAASVTVSGLSREG